MGICGGLISLRFYPSFARVKVQHEKIPDSDNFKDKHKNVAIQNHVMYV